MRACGQGVLLAGALMFAAAVGSRAEVLEQWTFADPAGTPLTATENSGAGGAEWTVDFLDTATDGEGALVTRRDTMGPANSYAPIQTISSFSAPAKVWLVIEVPGWNFAGETVNECVRLGFTDNTHEERPNVVAQIRIERVGEDIVVLAGDAFGPGAAPIEDQAIFRALQEEPVTFILELDKEVNQFVLHYRIGDGELVQFGEGRTSRERDARFLRIGLAGNFAARGEFFSIGPYTLTAADPRENP